MMATRSEFEARPAPLDERSWHSLGGAEVARALVTDPVHGMGEAWVDERLDRHGENRLLERPPRSGWLEFADRLKDWPFLLLLGGAFLAGLASWVAIALAFLAAALSSALLGFWRERRAQAILARLRQRCASSARVRRDGVEREVPAVELVPGDVVLLAAGDRVPADGRILSTHEAEIDESILTGEAEPAIKEARIRFPPETPLAERANMAYMHTVVMRGRLEMLVTATGMATEIGRLADTLEPPEPGATALSIQLEALVRRIALVVGPAILLILLLWLMHGQYWLEALLIAITLAVAAIPEALPSASRLMLALGVRRLSRQRVIVKTLAAMESLARVNAICADARLLMNPARTTVGALFFRGRRLVMEGDEQTVLDAVLAGDGVLDGDCADLLVPAALCHGGAEHEGAAGADPSTLALRALALKGGLDAGTLVACQPRIATIPFDALQTLTASLHQLDEGLCLYVKGHPEALLSRSASWLGPDGPAALDASTRARLRVEYESLAARPMHVLALARKEIPAERFAPGDDLMDACDGLLFLGLVGLLEPPRPEAREAIESCARAGIQVRLVTREPRPSARAIASDLGLAGEVVEGRELDILSETELDACLDRVAVFARVAPEHRVRLVRQLQSRGRVVAMTGSDVEDIPAFALADLGVAMGAGGARVAGEAADLVLVDDDFAALAGAVREGRAMRENLVKFARFQLALGLGAILTLLVAGLLGWAAPLGAIQWLWIAVFVAGSLAMTLAVEPIVREPMDEPPPSGRIRLLSAGRLLPLLFQGAIMAIGSLILFRHALPLGQANAVTLAFTTFVLFQCVNLFNARVELGSAFGPVFLRNRWLWMVLVLVVALQVVIVHWPVAQALFGTTALALSDWLLALLVASSLLWFDELRRLAVSRRAVADWSQLAGHLRGAFARAPSTGSEPRACDTTGLQNAIAWVAILTLLGLYAWLAAGGGQVTGVSGPSTSGEPGRDGAAPMTDVDRQLERLVETAARQKVVLEGQVAEAQGHLAELKGVLRTMRQPNEPVQAARPADRPLQMDAAITRPPLGARLAELGARHTERGLLLNLGESDLSFPVGQATLPAGALPSLDRLAALLADSPALRARIEGYTDSSGREEVNRLLSEARAEAVRQALVERGVARERVDVVGLGESDPIADNATEEGRQRNRRIEIYILGG